MGHRQSVTGEAREEHHGKREGTVARPLMGTVEREGRRECGWTWVAL